MVYPDYFFILFFKQNIYKILQQKKKKLYCAPSSQDPGQHSQFSLSTDGPDANNSDFVSIAGLKEDTKGHLLLSFA